MLFRFLKPFGIFFRKKGLNIVLTKTACHSKDDVVLEMSFGDFPLYFKCDRSIVNLGPKLTSFQFYNPVLPYFTLWPGFKD